MSLREPSAPHTSSSPQPPAPTAATSDTSRVAEALTRLAPELERFWTFAGPDLAVRERDQWAAVLDTDLPTQGAGLDTVLDELGVAVRYGARFADPGFSGFITTGPSTAGVAAAAAASAAGGQRYTLHAFNGLEHVGLRWLAATCAIPRDWDGVFSSGGSVANLLALGAARQWTFEQRGVDVSQTGLPSGVPCRIYVSSEAHRTIHRSAAVLGLGRDAVREVPTDARQRIDVAALGRALEDDAAAGIVPLAVVAIAGTTNTGAIDPIADVIEVARRHGAWVHVDGAYGLVAAADPQVRPRLAAAADADSAIVDPHKWMATGVGVAATFVRHPGVLVRAFAEGEAAYLEGSFSAAPEGAVSQFESMGGLWADMSLELSAPSRGVYVWAVLREIGLDGLGERVRWHRELARRLTDTAREHPRLQALTDPELSIACVRYLPEGSPDEAGGPELDALTARLLQRVQRETGLSPSSTVVGGRLAIRPCYINPRTTVEHVDGLAEALVRFGDEETQLR